jgi:hypothetical protein
MPAAPSLRARLLTIFGDLKVYRFPMFFLYDPGGYRVRGEDAREVIDVVKPGDILLRGYDSYLDGYFIPGYFSHAGLYIGPVTDNDIDLVERPCCRGVFRTGAQMVIHSMAEGVFMEDLLNFCRCDYMAILRFPDTVVRDPDAAPIPIRSSEWNDLERGIFQELEKRGKVAFNDAFGAIRTKALSSLGRPYDFGFDWYSFDRLSCTEFVYLCTKSLSSSIQLRPTPERVLFLRRNAIRADAFLDVGLRVVWCSRSASESIRHRVDPRPESARGTSQTIVRRMESTGM